MSDCSCLAVSEVEFTAGLFYCTVNMFLFSSLSHLTRWFCTMDKSINQSLPPSPNPLKTCLKHFSLFIVHWDASEIHWCIGLNERKTWAESVNRLRVCKWEQRSKSRRLMSITSFVNQVSVSRKVVCEAVSLRNLCVHSLTWPFELPELRLMLLTWRDSSAAEDMAAHKDHHNLLILRMWRQRQSESLSASNNLTWQCSGDRWSFPMPVLSLSVNNK